MPKHRPIYFKEPKFSEESKNKLKDFIERHPVATPATKALLATAILGGVLTLAVVAPGLTRLASQYKNSKKNNERERYRILWERFNFLKKRHFFECAGELDFYQLQRSVWLHPFSCAAEINFLKDVFDIHPFVEVFVAEDITNGKAVYHFQDLLKDYV